jgi:gliding motility-associated-like protein
MKKLITLSFLLLIAVSVFGQGNSTCANALPFCTGQTMNFPAGVNSGNAQPGPNYGCLGSQPNPAWFYMQIAQGGPLVITMSAPQDIDFICWGPFPNLAGACNSLTAGNTVDCSYSGSNTETCTISNAIPGQFYLLLITNYANVVQNITFQQINSGQPGAATTNCGVICSLTVTGTSTLCSGTAATLSAVGGTQVVNINWTGPAGYSSFNNPNPTIPTLTASGVYTALATTSGTNPGTNTCAVTKSITVFQNPIPVANNNGPLCAGNTASLTGGGGGTYAWSGPGGFTDFTSAPFVANAQPTNSGVYTVTVTLNTCTAVATTSLLVKPNPTVTATNSGSYCTGQSFNLLGTGANSYTWAGPNFNSNFQMPVFSNINVNMSGIYNLTGAVNGCTSMASTTVTVYALPTVTLSSSGDVCQNFPLTLSAGGATSYVWSGPMGFSSAQSTIFTPSAPVVMTGSYLVIGTDINGCKNTATINQMVYPTPALLAFGAKSCYGETLNFSASGGIFYSWTGPDSFTSSVQNPTIPAGYQNAGSYTVVTTGAGSCTNIAVVSATVYSPPLISWSGNASVCKGDIFTFKAAGGVVYKWLDRNGIISNTDTYTVSSVDPNYVGSYTVLGYNEYGCGNSTVVNPNILPLPVGAVGPVTEGACVPFTAKYQFEKKSANIIKLGWSMDDGNFVMDSLIAYQQILVPGLHKIKVDMIDANGCKNSVTTTVEGYPVPSAAIRFSNDYPTEMDNSVTFYDNSSGANITKWYWDFASNGVNVSRKQNPTYAYPGPGKYLVYLKVTSDYGCVDSTGKLISVEEDLTFYIPNSFTPNGDGLNDTFTPKGISIKKYQMDIFDRWGELLFTTTDLTVGWDGRKKSSGEILPSDVYVYKITVLHKDGQKSKEYTGHVSILK